jgi:hypothetical protein
MRIIIFLSLLWLPGIELLAQEKTEQAKLSKHEKMQMAAYDDTTQMLAGLFIEKRNSIKRTQNTCIWIFAGSAGTFVLGGAMLAEDLNSPAGVYNPASYTGLGVMFIGVLGMTGSAATIGIQQIRRNPYTIRKFNRLIEMRKNGHPLPDFYREKMRTKL